MPRAILWGHSCRVSCACFVSRFGARSARRVCHAKAAAYSSILTFFPTLLLIGSVLATSRQTEAYLREISDAVGKILPPGPRLRWLICAARPSVRWRAHYRFADYAVDRIGVMISWMEGFRRCYELPKSWGW